jgi:cobalamin biosynthesis Co2+ chelatase CbiK
MKKIILNLLLLVSTNIFSNEKAGLLIITHGSPSNQWNQLIFDLENQVKKSLKIKKITDFDEVRVAFMEFTGPSISAVVKDMEDKGINTIFALPLFIAPSEHSLYEIPTVLGLYYDEKTVSELEEKKITCVETNVKITLGLSLDFKNVIKNILLDKVRQISDNPKEEALVILAHGDENFNNIWEKLINETGGFISEQIGIEYFDKAFVGIGQSFDVNGVKPILRAAGEKERVIVMGMYLAMGVENMAKTSGYFMNEHTTKINNLFEGKNIYFAKEGLLPNQRITQWIVNKSIHWLNNK